MEPMDQRAPTAELFDALEEEKSADEATIVHPFDPEEIDVITKKMNVQLLLSRVRNGMIDLQPDFQRRWGIWNLSRQSRLIESLLLRIPLPSLYAAETENEAWEIVDGIQRLSTVARFIAPDIIGETEPMCLHDLEYLTNLNGRIFSELDRRLRTRLEEAELDVHLIRRGTPPAVKYNIFARVNSGGVQMDPQELRHAITPGPARDILRRMAESPAFLKATDGRVNPMRMADRELALRFIAFRLTPPQQYPAPNMDAFLLDAMRRLNRLPINDVAVLMEEFTSALLTAYKIFGRDAFRKRSDPTATRQPINKALFEAVMVELALLSEAELSRLSERAAIVRERFLVLCRDDRDFESAISQGTGDIRKVQRRFERIHTLFRGVLDEHSRH